MITATEKSAVKSRMLDVCIERQQLLIDDFRIRIKSLLESGPLGNEEAYDNNALSLNAQSANEADALNNALTFANEEMATLNSLRAGIDELTTQVAPGSVVITNLSSFFISVSIEQFETGGHTYVGVSTKSPLFQAMKGKRAGQTFSYNGLIYHIKDVF